MTTAPPSSKRLTYRSFQEYRSHQQQLEDADNESLECELCPPFHLCDRWLESGPTAYRRPHLPQLATPPAPLPHDSLFLARTLRPVYGTLPRGIKVPSVEREELPLSQLAHRLDVFGHLGDHMLDALRAHGVRTRAVHLLHQCIDVDVLSSLQPFLGASYSLMYSDISIQVEGSPDCLYQMAHAAYQTHTLLPQTAMDLDQTATYNLFPYEKNLIVPYDTNLYFHEVWDSLSTHFASSREAILTYSHYMKGMSHDQATACIMYATILYEAHIPHAAQIAIQAVRFPDWAQQLSTAIKNLGMQWRKEGALLVEGAVLQGRATEPIPLQSLIEERCQKSGLKMLNVNTQQLHQAVMEVLEEEMNMDKLYYEPVKHFWSRRWQWGVNGAHARLLQNHEPKFIISPEGLIKWHRRVYLEEVEENPLEEWSGNVYVTSVKKLEIGKERALQPVDTNTYICFVHLLESVEKAWRDKRVILNPGEGNYLHIANRIRAMRGKEDNGYNVMIDFAEYDTQHTIRSQQVVIRALCHKIGYPRNMSLKLIKSFECMNMYIGNKFIGLLQGTLCSGHRVTSFCNSILNLAYLKIYCKTIDDCKSMHVGDDVYAWAPDLKTALQLMLELKASPIRAKPEKQSVGQWSAGFLRMCTRGNVTRGYVTRKISSCIMGDWANDLQLEPQDALQHMVAAAWSLGNRSENPQIGLLLKTAMCRMCGMSGDHAAHLLTGKEALNNGPMRYTEGRKHKTHIHINFIDVEKVKTMDIYRSGASRDFCMNHLTPLEWFVIRECKVSVKGPMRDASYFKSVLHSNKQSYVSNLGYRRSKERGCIRKSDSLVNIMYSKPPGGALEGFPIMRLMKGLMDTDVIVRCLKYLGTKLSGNESEEEILKLAWGIRHDGCVIQGWLPYFDAAALSALTEVDLIKCGEIMLLA